MILPPPPPKAFPVQIICKMGHVSNSVSALEPDRLIAGGICACPRCGARADWVRKRPTIVTTYRDGTNTQPEEHA